MKRSVAWRSAASHILPPFALVRLSSHPLSFSSTTSRTLVLATFSLLHAAPLLIHEACNDTNV